MANGTPLAEAFVRIRPEGSSFKGDSEKIVGNAGTSAGHKFSSGFGEAIKGLGGIMAGLFAVEKITAFFGESIAGARESAKVGALTEQVIKSTGGAAGVSAAGVNSLATSLSNLTGMDDEAIQGAENLLLTFTNVKNGVGAGNNIFDQATEAVANMSTALGQDLKSSSLQVGKALNDPVNGMTALSKAGVSFTEEQKASVKAMVASGNTMGAQKVILAELSKEFGGAAAAAAVPGDRARVAFGNLQEMIGGKLLPVIDGIATVFVDKVAPVITDFFDQVDTGSGPVGRLAGWLGQVSDAGKGVFDLLSTGDFTGSVGKALGVEEDDFTVGFLLDVRDNALNMGNSFTKNVVPALQGFGGSLAALGPKLAGSAGQMSSSLSPAVRDISSLLLDRLIPAALQVETAIATGLGPVIEDLAYWFSTEAAPAINSLVGEIVRMYDTVLPIVQEFINGMMQRLAPLMPTIKAIFTTIGGIITGVMGLIGAIIHQAVTNISIFWDQWGKQIMDVVSVVFTSIVNFIAPILSFIQNIIKAVTAAINGDWSGAWEALKDAGENIWQAIVAGIQGTLDILKAVFDAVWPAIKQAAIDAWNGIKQAASDAWNGITQAVATGVDDAVSFVQSLPGKMVDAVGDMGSLLLHKGEDLVQGLINGISGMGGSLNRFITKWIKENVPAPVAAALGINSPSTVMRDLGVWVGPGLSAGIDEKAYLVEDSMKALVGKTKLPATDIRLGASVTEGAAARWNMASKDLGPASPVPPINGPVDLSQDTIAAIGDRMVSGAQSALVTDKWGSSHQRTTRGRSW